jgi:predicted  nucleic acid-binding Zn-ribbon protein
MPSPTIDLLLILQDRDTKKQGIENQLKAVPREIAAVEQRIASEKAAIEAAKGELRELESRKKLLETEIGSAETQLGKYRTQQLLVKKNDEYQALGHEIENVQKQIDELEGTELQAMYGIDEAKKRFAAAEGTLKQNISGHEARIRTMKERDMSFTEELKGASAEAQAARAPLSEAALEAYDKAVGRRGLPAVVPIRGGKCGGCHLKVSSEVESAARGKAVENEFATCDQCSRMVYWES